MCQGRILLVDDSPNVLKALQRSLRGEGHELLTAPNAAEAQKVLACNKVDMIITDQTMPGMSGTELLAIVSRQYPAVCRIMLTGATDIGVAQEAINEGAIYRFFTKPWNDFELLASIRQAFELKRLTGENAELKEAVKQHEAMLTVLEKQHPGITRCNVDSDGALIIEV